MTFFSSSNSGSKALQSLALKQSSKDFIDCVVNPFESDRPGRIPDMNTANTLSFRDNAQADGFLNDFDIKPDGTSASGPISSICLWFSSGYNGMTASYNSTYNFLKFYSCSTFGLASDGTMRFHDIAGDAILPTVDTQNYTQIFGGNTNTLAYDIDTSLVQSTRLVSAGMRLLSNVEQVTDTSQNYVSYFTVGQISANELYAAGQNESDVLALLRNRQHTQIYPNNEGCMSRYNPFQTNTQDDIHPLQLAWNVATRTDDSLSYSYRNF